MAPYPPSGPATFAALLETLPEGIRAVAIQLRAIVKATLPEADEAVSGAARIGMALYSIGGPTHVVCGIQPTETTCRLFFHGWEALKEAGFSLEGSGAHARHVKVGSAREIDPAKVAEMLRIAARAR